MENIWLTWAKRLQSIASTGLHFARERYDQERYAEIATIANEMLSFLADVPVSKIEKTFSDFARGYATPTIDVRGAVFDGDKILLVREATDRLWTLPGGYADVGLSAGENVVKEIWEEASIRVRARALYGIRHKAKHEYDPDVRDFYKLFFLCERTDAAIPTAGPEILEVGFFSFEELPALSRGRVLEKDIAAAYAYRADTQKLALFD